MKVSELIQCLLKMPQYAQVYELWDGEPRSVVNHVWLAKSGNVIVGDCGELVYTDDARPEGAPTLEEEEYWCTPEKSMGTDVVNEYEDEEDFE